MGTKQVLKRGFALLLSGALMMTPMMAATYTDTSGNWAESAIEKWSGSYGILQGYDDGTFRPDATITRGAFAGIMVRFLQYIQTSSSGTFSDTFGEYWEDSILKLNAAGVYLSNNGKANLHDNITRQQAIAMIARAFGISETAGTLSYADAGSVASYAYGDLLTMKNAGYITDVGSDNCFRPSDDITRAEVVNILNNMISVLYQTGGVYTSNVRGTLMINATEGATLKNMSITGDLIIAPGVTGEVSLADVSISGSIRNLGSAAVTETSMKDTGVWPTIPQYTGEHFSYDGASLSVPVGTQAMQLDQSSFYWDENGSLRCNDPNYTTRYGIDVSSHQGRIDWNAVAATGIEFALVRVGGRGTSTGGIYTDTFGQQNLAGATAAGIETGAYFFSQATSPEEAIEEANFVIGQLQGYNITGPVMFDWEMKDKTYRVYGTTPEVATACALTFCKTIEDAGYRAAIYMGKYVGYVKYGAYFDQIASYATCYAGYPASGSANCYPSFYYQPNYWQYSDSGKIDGISSTHVDLDMQFIRN